MNSFREAISVQSSNIPLASSQQSEDYSDSKNEIGSAPGFGLDNRDRMNSGSRLGRNSLKALQDLRQSTDLVFNAREEEDAEFPLKTYGGDDSFNPICDQDEVEDLFQTRIESSRNNLSAFGKSDQRLKD